jgi:hypothetical protein
MAGRLSSERIVDPVLTNLAIGYSNAEMVGHHLLPYANVDKESGHLPKFGKDDFLIYQTERALRADSNRGQLDVPGKTSFMLTEHDLEFAVDDREEAESVFSARRRAMVRAVNGIRLRHEKKVADMVQSPANYAVSNKIALTTTDAFDDPASDPEGVVDDAKAAISAGIVKDPNTMVISYDIWRQWKKHAKLKAILSDDRPRLVQLADLREIFEIPNIIVGKAMWKSDAAGAATERIWKNSVVLAYVPTAMSVAPNEGGVVDPGDLQDIGEPAFGYTFRKRGMPQVDVRRAPNGKMDLVRDTDLFETYLVGADAGYLIQSTPD